MNAITTLLITFVTVNDSKSWDVGDESGIQLKRVCCVVTLSLDVSGVNVVFDHDCQTAALVTFNTARKKNVL